MPLFLKRFDWSFEAFRGSLTNCLSWILVFRLLNLRRISSLDGPSQALESIRPYGLKHTFTDGMYKLRPAAGKTYRGALLSDPVRSTDREVD